MPDYGPQVDPRALKAETLEVPSERALIEQLKQAKYRHELGIGDQTAESLGDAVDQSLKRIQFNR